MSLRSEQIARLQTQSFDLFIVGGGIVGAGIARDAAMRGLRVALIEQGDFASGTSSKTSKLIHGGLRYLEHGHIGLVFESLRERAILRTIAPASVHPLSLLLPVYRGDRRAPATINVGLWLYDLLAIGRNVAPHRMVSARRALALEPNLRVEGLRAAGLYADCRMDDARVCLLNILQAVQFGASCANYVRLVAFLKDQHGRLCGGEVEDLAGGRTFEIFAKVVVNATGPWSDRIRVMSESQATPRLAPTKGIHLIVRRIAHEALFVQARDGRMLFVLPWGDDGSLIGTTETPVRGSLEELAAESDEVGYLLDATNRILPGSHLDEEAIITTFAGARPLLAFDGSSTSASREHRIETDASGLISVLGGKYTTYRRIAQQTVDVIVRREHWRTERCLSDQVSLLESTHPVAMAQWHDLTRAMDPDVLARLISRYGVSCVRVLQLISLEPALGLAVCPHHEVLAAELIHAFQQELACTITDVLARRTRIAWSSCQGLDFLSMLTDLARRYAGLSPRELEQQVQAYHQFLRLGLAFRSGSGAAAPLASSQHG